MFLPLQGALLRTPIYQGDALGYVLVALYSQAHQQAAGAHGTQLLRKLFFSAYYFILSSGPRQRQAAPSVCLSLWRAL